MSVHFMKKGAKLMVRKSCTIFVMAMLSFMLLWPLSGYAAASESVGAVRAVMKQAPSEIETVSGVSARFDEQQVGYVDPDSGTIYYNISGVQDDKRWYSVVEKSPDGTLMRWEDGFSAIYPVMDGAPRVSILPSKYSAGDMDQGFYYDAASSTVYEGNAYIVSPDQQWALYENSSYTVPLGENGPEQPQREYRYWLKEAKTHELQEIFTSPSYTGATWTADSQIIVQRYSEQAKQNEIVLFDPNTLKWKFLMNASMVFYLRDRHLLVYTNNEPTRQPKTYDLNTHQTRAISTEELNQLSRERWTSYKDVEELDPELNVSRLPVKSMVFTRHREHKVELDGQIVKLPYALQKNGTLWLPVRPMAEALSWKIEPIQTEAAHYQYGIQQGSSRIELQNTNSIVIHNRLFMTRGQLQSLGYKEIEVSPNITNK